MDNCNKLWIVEFTVNKKNGCAIVKAPNPKVVETILRTNGIYNGTPHLYKITRIEEIIKSPESMLIAEQINE